MVDIETANVTPLGDWDMTGGDVKVPAPAVDADASTKKYVDDEISGSGAGRLDQIANPNTDKDFSMGTNTLRFGYTGPAGGDGAFEIEASAGFSGDLVHIHQSAGNPGAVDLVHLEYEDVDVVGLRINGSAALFCFEQTDGTDILTLNQTILAMTGDITVTGTVDGIDVGTDVAANTLKDSSFWETKDGTTNRFKTEKHIDMELRGIFGMINPTAADGAATKDYVDTNLHDESHNAASHSDITASGADIDDAVTKKHAAGTDPNDHASGSDDQDISGIATNTTHRGSAGGTDHSDVNTNNSKISYTKTNVKGHIEHGGTSGTTRPTGFTSVEWIGTVEPSNAVNGDTWIDTS